MSRTYTVSKEAHEWVSVAQRYLTVERHIRGQRCMLKSPVTSRIIGVAALVTGWLSALIVFTAIH